MLYLYYQGENEESKFKGYYYFRRDYIGGRKRC